MSISMCVVQWGGSHSWPLIKIPWEHKNEEKSDIKRTIKSECLEWRWGEGIIIHYLFIFKVFIMEKFWHICVVEKYNNIMNPKDNGAIT